MGLDPSSLNLRLRGKQRLQTEEAAELARLLGVTLEDVLTAAGIKLDEPLTKKGGARVPIVGWVDSEMAVHRGRVAGKQYAEAPPVPIEGLEAVRCQTAMSRADALDGAVMYYRPGHDVGADAIGKLCVVLTDAGATLLRVVRPGYARGTYNLAGMLDGRIEENTRLVSASPVVWMRL